MLVFVECDKCKELVKVSTRNDIKLLISKTKEVVLCECSNCLSSFEISIKLKVKDIAKSKSKLAL